MALFQAILYNSLDKEGGYSNLPTDRGGETYRGISRVYFKNWKGWQIIDKNKPLRQGQIINNTELNTLIEDFYKANFWDKIKGEQINNKSLAALIFDTALHSGNKQAIVFLQRALNENNFKLKIDGIIGPKTLQATNQANQKKLFDSYKKQREIFLENLGKQPGQDIFVKGWAARLSSFTFQPELIGVIILISLILIIFKQ